MIALAGFVVRLLLNRTVRQPRRERWGLAASIAWVLVSVCASRVTGYYWPLVVLTLALTAWGVLLSWVAP